MTQVFESPTAVAVASTLRGAAQPSEQERPEEQKRSEGQKQPEMLTPQPLEPRPWPPESMSFFMKIDAVVEVHLQGWPAEDDEPCRAFELAEDHEADTNLMQAAENVHVEIRQFWDDTY